MNLQHLRYFLEVARERSFTRAARKLRISQPAISKQVLQLEDALGYKLLLRSRSGVTLTPEGQAAFVRAARVFAEAAAIPEAIARESRTEVSGELNVGVSDNLAIYLYNDALARFRAAHPRLRLRVFVGTSADIKTEILAERLEAGVFFTPPKAHEPFSAEQISETEFWIVLAPSCPALRGHPGRKLTVKDLQRLRVPRMESRHQDYAHGFPAHFHSRRLGFRDEPWLEVNNHEVKKRWALAGHGFAVLTRPTVEAEVRAGSLLRVSTPTPLPAPIYWVTRRNRPVSRAASALRAAIIT